MAQPLIENDLLKAEPSPGFKGGEIQEPEVDRLFQLVDPIPREKDGGDVRVKPLDSPHCMRVERHIGQCVAYALKTVSNIHPLRHILSMAMDAVIPLPHRQPPTRITRIPPMGQQDRPSPNPSMKQDATA